MAIRAPDGANKYLNITIEADLRAFSCNSAYELVALFPEVLPFTILFPEAWSELFDVCCIEVILKKRFVQRLDLDSDGVVSLEEFLTTCQQVGCSHCRILRINVLQKTNHLVWLIFAIVCFWRSKLFQKTNHLSKGHFCGFCVKRWKLCH